MDEMSTLLKPNGMSDEGRGLQDEHPIDIDRDDDEWIKKVTSIVNTQPPRRQGRMPCTIFKIQDSIRLRNEDAYRPLLISIGPYHYQRLSKTNSHVTALENLKWVYLRSLLFRNRSRRNATYLLKECLLAMKKLDTEVRSYYSEELDNLKDVHDLALVMFLDGCFILQLLLYQQQHKQRGEIPATDKKDDKEDEVGEHGEVLLTPGEKEDFQYPLLLGMLWTKNIVAFDMLKLENQIPFIVLTTLFNLLRVPGDEGNLVELAFNFFSDIYPSISHNSHKLPEANEVHHLLHLLHSTLVPLKNNDLNDTKQEMKALKRITKWITNQTKLHNTKIPSLKKSVEWIPNAIELRQAGVKFVEKKTPSSFLDISFIDGKMEIPKLKLHDHTDTFFRNMIAFEQCYPDVGTYVTTYAVFMDCIIDTPNDAHLLHLKGILSNRLSTDEAAAELFNKLCYQIHNISNENYLHKICSDVDEFYNSKFNKWRAKLKRDYFSNPWAIISVIAAGLLLVLTVEQSFFSTFTYFWPHA